jgi:hypothetical protein
MDQGSRVKQTSIETEISEFNRVNLDKINELDWNNFSYVAGIACTDKDYLFTITDTRKEYPKDKYICSMYLLDKETDTCMGVIQFGFTYRNRLRRKVKELQKETQDIACVIIAEVKHD